MWTGPRTNQTGASFYCEIRRWWVGEQRVKREGRRKPRHARFFWSTPWIEPHGEPWKLVQSNQRISPSVHGVSSFLALTQESKRAERWRQKQMRKMQQKITLTKSWLSRPRIMGTKRLGKQGKPYKLIEQYNPVMVVFQWWTTHMVSHRNRQPRLFRVCRESDERRHHETGVSELEKYITREKRPEISVGKLPMWSLQQFKNIILEGVPGTGKTFAYGEVCKNWEKYTGRKCNSRAMTFHPSTSYEDFVIGIRPRRPQQMASTLRCQTGIYPPIVSEALARPEEDFVVLLDEFNRANVPKVLGDLLTVVESGKRATYNDSKLVWEPPVEITLPLELDSETEPTAFLFQTTCTSSVRWTPPTGPSHLLTAHFVDGSCLNELNQWTMRNCGKNS